MSDKEYLKQIIKHLIELNNYPDISINYYTETFNDKTRITAELILCTGEMLTANVIIDSFLLNENNLIKKIEEDLLRVVGYKYIKRAIEKRKAGGVNTRAGNFLRSCQSISKQINGGNNNDK